jgi:hypothetical protein
LSHPTFFLSFFSSLFPLSLLSLPFFCLTLLSSPLFISYTVSYNRLCGEVKKLANRISLLDPTDPFRHKMAEGILLKLIQLGLYFSMHFKLL